MNNRRLALEAWENLFRAQHELFEVMAVDFEGATISSPEYDVLLTVTRGRDHTAKLRDITAKALISQPSVSRLVDRMAMRGLVVKAPDPDDGRGTLVTATETGAQAFRELAVQHGRRIVSHMAVLTPEEQQTLVNLTAKLRASVR